MFTSRSWRGYILNSPPQASKEINLFVLMFKVRIIKMCNCILPYWNNVMEYRMWLISPFNDKFTVVNIANLLPPHPSKKLQFSVAILSNRFILARLLYLRCKKVQGSISGRKIKRNTSSAVWNTERKYDSTPHSRRPCSKADIGIAE